MRTWYRNIDWTTLLCWIFLVGIGLASIYSATRGPASQYLLLTVQQNFERQLTWALISFGVLVVIMFVPARYLQKMSLPIYIGTVALAIATLFFGREINGEKSWLFIGPFGIQSSELAKVGVLMAVAFFLSDKNMNKGRLRYTLGAILLIMIPTSIILLQKDTGTALVFLGLIPVILFWSGLSLNVIMLMVAPAVAGYLAIVYMPGAIVFVMLFTLFMYYYSGAYSLTALAGLITGGTIAGVYTALHKVLEPHQLARIASFVDPEAYRLTSGFHVIQAKAAIGSGGLWGKGFMQGTQTQLAFVPEQSTDFIFCVIGEEFGFIGAIAVLAVFGILLTRLVFQAVRVRSTFATVFTGGIVGIYLIHMIVNIGMTTGSLPVIGIPLPFVSYGGSALVANTMMLAVALNLFARRDDFSIYRY